MTTDTDTVTTSYADRLRALADHLDANPVLAERVDKASLQRAIMPTIGIIESDPERFRELASALPGQVTYEGSDRLYYARSEHGVYVFGNVDQLCERTQIAVEPVYDFVLKTAVSA